jgi:hypothetical protein
MAPRKPNKSRRDKPSDSLANQVGGWLGGAAKVVGRAAAQNPLVAQNVKYGRAVMAGPTQVAKTAAIDLAAGAAGAAGAKAAQVAAKTAASVKAVRQANKLDWDPKPFVEGVRTPDRASFYWKPETDVVNPMNPDVSYSVAVRPANPKAARSALRSTDKGYKVEVSRFSENRVNEMFDSAADYNKIVGAKPSSSVNAPTSDQLFRSLQSNKVYKDLQKAQRAAERLVKRDIKRR